MENKTVNRIKEYLDYKSISLNAFDKAIEAGNGYFGKQLKRQASVGSDVIEKIVCKYPDLNVEWLITGRGEMLYTPNASKKNNNNTPTTSSENIPEHYSKTTRSVHPTTVKTVHPTVHPTQNLGLPKVVTVTENDKELVSFVNAKSAAGYLNGYADTDYVENLPTIRIPNLGGGTHRAFEIVGHSMNPTLHNHAIGIGRWVESFEDIRDRRIYTVVTKSEGIVTKRVLNRISDSGRLILISDNQNKRDYPNILLDASEVLEIWYLRGALSFEFPEPDILYNRVNDLEAKVTLLMDHFQKGVK